jgi:integrase
MKKPRKPQGPDWRHFKKERSPTNATLKERIEAKLAHLEREHGEAIEGRSHYKLIAEAFGDMHPSAIQSEDVEAWLTWLRVVREYSNSTIRKQFYLLRALIEEAVADGSCASNGARVARSAVPKKGNRPGFDRSREIPSVDELQRILEASLEPTLVFAALGYLAGMRFGEISALTWEQWQRDTRPLGTLVVDRAYKSKAQCVSGTKTGITRKVPTHPALASILNRWHSTGWRAAYGRDPKTTDLVVPYQITRGPRISALVCRRDTRTLDDFGRFLHALGLAPRTLHSMRHAFITLTRNGGADRDTLKEITHTSRKSDAFGAYENTSHEAMCRAVLCHPISAIEPREPPLLSTKETKKGSRPRASYPSGQVLALRGSPTPTLPQISWSADERRLTRTRHRPAPHLLLKERGRLRAFAPTLGTRRGFPPRATVPTAHRSKRRG